MSAVFVETHVELNNSILLPFCFAAMPDTSARKVAGAVQPAALSNAVSQRAACCPPADRSVAQPAKSGTRRGKFARVVAAKLRETFVLNFRKPGGQLLRLQWRSEPGWYCLETRPRYKVSWIKARIREVLTQGRSSYKPPYIALAFGCQVLKNFRTLKSYGIHSGSELTVVSLAHHPWRHQPC